MNGRSTRLSPHASRGIDLCFGTVMGMLVGHLPVHYWLLVVALASAVLVFFKPTRELSKTEVCCYQKCDCHRSSE